MLSTRPDDDDDDFRPFLAQNSALSASRLLRGQQQSPLGHVSGQPAAGVGHRLAFQPMQILAEDDAEDMANADDDPQAMLVEGPHRRRRRSSGGLPPRPDEDDFGSVFASPFRDAARHWTHPSSAHPSSSQLPLLDRIWRFATTWWRDIWSGSREAAMYEWTNVDDLDSFFCRVYTYYLRKGLFAILLDRTLNLVALGFVIVFTTFLAACVDYDKLHGARRLDDVVIGGCLRTMPSWMVAFVSGFSAYFVYLAWRLCLDVPGLRQMHQFYTHLLEIPDAALSTARWPAIVQAITWLRAHTPTILNADPSMRLDAHTITNRIMRKENYMVAMFNRDLFDLRLPWIGRGPMLTKSLEWNLQTCVESLMFSETGELRPEMLKGSYQHELTQRLRQRFHVMAVINALCAPLIALYLLLFFFFRYFEQYQKNPSSIGNRQYTPFARWKLREFDELPHLFQHRLNRSYTKAMLYLDQFPAIKTAMLARFIAFTAGAVAAVLGILTLVHQDLLLNFEITPERTVFFYLGIFGSVLAVARGLVPDEHVNFEPRRRLLGVVEDTHYLPEEWRQLGLHTTDVRDEFSRLFDYKLSVFVQEILSVIYTPLILWFSLPKSAPKVVDFVRAFTIHVDGVGYVCSFAVFDFDRSGTVKASPAGEDTPEDDTQPFCGDDNKMAQSFVNFKQNYPDWQPTSDPTGSVFLDRVQQRLERQHQLRQPAARLADAAAQVPEPNKNVLSPRIGQYSGMDRGVKHTRAAGEKGLQSGGAPAPNPRLRTLLPDRRATAHRQGSPATGSPADHALELPAVDDSAFGVIAATQILSGNDHDGLEHGGDVYTDPLGISSVLDQSTRDVVAMPAASYDEDDELHWDEDNPGYFQEVPSPPQNRQQFSLPPSAVGGHGVAESTVFDEMDQFYDHTRGNPFL